MQTLVIRAGGWHSWLWLANRLAAGLTSLDRIFYAVKANEAPEILKEVAAAGR